MTRPRIGPGPKVQVSLDLTTLDEALEVAEVAVAAGVDWLEAGTPLVLAEGVHAIRALHRRFPEHPIVADLKIMDGGGLETELAVGAGASFVVVMSRATDATVRAVVAAAKKGGALVMGDVLGCEDYGAEARRMESLGVDAVIAHLGFDERGEEPQRSVFDFLSEVVQATQLPVQAVGGIRLDDLPRLPGLGAPLVVVGAPLVISTEAFAPAADLETLGEVLNAVVRAVHGQRRGSDEDQSGGLG
ncbi:MAG TPA: orotidine 5'-phosphate decarboxylase / HUMPS family protein [Acidimicrobiales bacterium]|nr:orotidine 5'-phosphate decarboxylase / HUMPS family protein [Acidimicrobiales bacterium]